MIVGVSTKSFGPNIVSDITYAGTSFIGNGGGRAGSTTILGRPRTVELWYLPNPPSGNNTIRVTFTGSMFDIVAGATTWTGVRQTTPLGTYQGASADGSSTYSVVVPSATDEVVVDVLEKQGTCVPSPTSGGQTQRWNKSDGNDGSGSGSSQAGASTVTMSWTGCGLADFAIGAVPLKPFP